MGTSALECSEAREYDLPVEMIHFLERICDSDKSILKATLHAKRCPSQ